MHARGRFGDLAVFRSSRSIGPGDVFAPELLEAIERCVVMLVVVGPNWLVRGDDGHRRIDDPEDWVRREVRTALADGKRVVVVRFGGAPRLIADDLPDDIAELAIRQDVEVTHKNIAHLLPRLMDDLFQLEPELRIGATDGLRGLDEWWAHWSGVTRPSMPAALPVAGRDAEVGALGAWLAGPPSPLLLRCASTDEGSAFTAAVLELHHPDVRAVRLTSEAGAEHCVGLAPPLLVVVATPDVDVHALVARGLHVLLLQHIHTSSKVGGGVVTLPRLSTERALEVFLGAGLPHAQARKAAGVARRSMAVWRWKSADGLRAPEWAVDTMSGLVLAGSWSTSDRFADQDAVAGLLKADWEDIERFAQLTASSEAPLLHRSGTRWQLADSEAAWIMLRNFLTRSVLQRWHAMAVAVLTEPDPLLELPTDERFPAKAMGTDRKYSDEFRRAVALAAALMGADGEERLSDGLTGQSHASQVVREVLDLCNGDRTGNTWLSVAEQLPLLAEAAPAEFLLALDEALVGDTPLLAHVLARAGERPGRFGLKVWLLWALETLCWSSEHLPHAARVLARLDELVTAGDNDHDQPLDSLRRVFQPGWAYTSATLETRLQVVDGLSGRYPGVWWKLLRELVSLPPSRLHQRTKQPECRDSWLPETEGPTPDEMEAAFDGVAERVVLALAAGPQRWIDLVPLTAYIPVRQRDRIVQGLSEADFTTLDDEQVLRLWSALDEFVRVQRTHPGMVADHVVATFAAVADQVEPQQRAERYVWLFTALPRLPGVDWDDIAGYDRELAALRADAVRKAAGAGLAGLLELARRSKQPDEVGAVTARATEDLFLDDVVLFLGGPGHEARFARSWVETRVREGGEPWWRPLVTRITTWSARGQADFLIALSRSADVSALLDVVGGEVAELFWRQVPPWPPVGDEPERFFDLVLEHRRPWSVISVLSRAVRVDPETAWARSPLLITKALTGAASDGSAERPYQGASFDVAHLLDHLTTLIGDSPEVAGLELVYRQYLVGHRVPRTLYLRMEADPAAFAEAVRLAHPGEGQPRLPLRVPAYLALRDWRWRQDGLLGLDQLDDYLGRARQVLAEDDRLLRCGDEAFGGMLTGVPAGDDGLWPVEAVRDLLDEPGSTALAGGFVMGVIGNRGTTARSLFEGGDQERRRAAKLEHDADAMAARWPRAAAVLRDCARAFRSYGLHNDDDAEDTRDEL